MSSGLLKNSGHNLLGLGRRDNTPGPGSYYPGRTAQPGFGTPPPIFGSRKSKKAQGSSEEKGTVSSVDRPEVVRKGFAEARRNQSRISGHAF